MKESFDELYKLLKLDRKNSHFSKDKTLETRYEEVVKEVEELGKAIKNKDMANLKEELGDALWDLLSLIIIAEEQDSFTAKDIIHEALEKLKRRKPWLAEGKTITKEEEGTIWKKAKAQEKEVGK